MAHRREPTRVVIGPVATSQEPREGFPRKREVPPAGGELPAYRWEPAGRSARAGLVVFQEIFGVSDYIRRRCADLAELGYVVVAPELYWRLEAAGVDPTVDEEQPDFLDRAMELVGQLDWSSAVGDGVATVEHLRAEAGIERVGALGFCFGGGLAFNVAAQTAVDVLVSYYGSALPNLLDLAPSVRAPSLHHFGTADVYLDPGTVERIRQAVTGPHAGEGTRFEVHEGAGHAFDNPHPMFHHPAASARAWQQTCAFLTAHLPPT
ncbi:MAG TPA: dienelactone hydrolase family protein [Segeticoccus sp.]|uniref:dienelactone hydrolase family protein n=1 Tax=Segeticoccus sp. TaxID=2706531 RepID=UPI002D7F3A92|nr:dienelactone hydrolase family protein [Segeticoccus sp.]HET8602028.1 dienelactone hydrolase family protein [Segeticoccus sp.]